MAVAAATQAFRATVVTPEAQVLDSEITAAQVPAYDGFVGILNMHAPLLTQLGVGVLRLKTTSGEQKFFVSNGYAQVKENLLTILTDEAIPVSQITAQFIAAQAAKAEALPATDPVSTARRQKAVARVEAMRHI